MKLIKEIAWSSIFFALVGCAQFHDVVPVNGSLSPFDSAVYKGMTNVLNENVGGLEEYRVFHQGKSSFVELQEMKESTTAEAVRFCGTKNKSKVVFLRETFSQPPHILGNFPRAELVFACTN